jgi:hypothetical protein
MKKNDHLTKLEHSIADQIERKTCAVDWFAFMTWYSVPIAVSVIVARTTTESQT